MRFPTPRRADLVLCALALCVPIALWLPRLAGPIDLRFDAGVYYILGASLAEGKGYRLLNEPGEPSAVQYPPLLPALVAIVHVAVDGANDTAAVARALRPIYLGFSLLYALLTYALARRFLAPGWAFLASLITNLSLYTFYLSDTLFAELPFGIASLALLAACPALDAAGRFWVRRASLLLGGLLFAAAFLLRTAGIALGAAWVAHSLVRRRWLDAGARVALCLVPFLAWQAYVRSVQNGPEYATPAYAYQRAPYQFYNVTYGENLRYVDPFAPEKGDLTLRRLAGRTVRNGIYHLQAIGESLSAARGFWSHLFAAAWTGVGGGEPPAWTDRIAWVALVPLSVMALGGLTALFLRGAHLVPLYALFGLGLLCVTPWPEQFLRYLMPLIPVLAIGYVVTARACERREIPVLPRRMQPWLSRSLLVAALGMQGYAVADAFGSRAAHEPILLPGSAGPGCRMIYAPDEWYAIHDAFLWLDERASRDAVVATTLPQWGYLQTGLRCVQPPLEADAAKAQELLDDVPVRYVILDALRFTSRSRYSLSRYAENAITAHPDRWRLVRGAPEDKLRVYERVDEAR